MLVAALLLLLLFVFPMWSITLTAPQYPEGITMYIWINKITGGNEFTLQNINILNHYIGMKYIVPESIPELTYFPYFVIAMTVMGLIFALLKSRKLYLVWLITMVVLGAMGIYDFYLWEYDYGHNLIETAPIKIPGMVYQPPLFGSKMLLNFKADSYPHWGGFFVFISMVLSSLAYMQSKKKLEKIEKLKKQKNDEVNNSHSFSEPVASLH